MVSRASTRPNDFCLPDLGEGLEEAELIEWCVHVGQRVEENETLAKMETAKALVEVPSPRGGAIAELHGKPGEVIKVGVPLVTYQPEAPVVETRRPAPSLAAKSGNGNGADKAPEPRPDAGTVVGSLGESSEATDTVRAVPAVRRLARDLGVDLHAIAGTGIGGRITRADVEAAGAYTHADPPEANPQALAASAGHEPRRTEMSADVSSNVSANMSSLDAADSTRIPFRGVRRTIAERLRHSINHAIHYTVMDEADVSSLDELRRRLMAASNEKITFLPFVSFAICRVLTGRFGEGLRRINSTVDDQKQEIVQHRPIHLGIATDTDSGLMVPVIRNADRMGVLEIGRHIARLAKAARERTIPAGRTSRLNLHDQQFRDDGRAVRNAGHQLS